jgi:hypothetical protein
MSYAQANLSPKEGLVMGTIKQIMMYLVGIPAIIGFSVLIYLGRNWLRPKLAAVLRITAAAFNWLKINFKAKALAFGVWIKAKALAFGVWIKAKALAFGVWIKAKALAFGVWIWNKMFPNSVYGYFRKHPVFWSMHFGFWILVCAFSVYYEYTK